jgi:hypothetical protein
MHRVLAYSIRINFLRLDLFRIDTVEVKDKFKSVAMVTGEAGDTGRGEGFVPVMAGQEAGLLQREVEREAQCCQKEGGGTTRQTREDQRSYYGILTALFLHSLISINPAGRMHSNLGVY